MFQDLCKSTSGKRRKAITLIKHGVFKPSECEKRTESLDIGACSPTRSDTGKDGESQGEESPEAHDTSINDRKEREL
ncbi:hypothetical protein AGABI1DRAFT_115534 [Agaricus bisporus var. burnettii JB137-S8]|uniref:Uncharacterized protein n=1 Tax=Agaricus bisporus var. burnettii (strain JB137-S8 / ATCC MYA-4627 / FGSC 10392) TaxID=597362 RepID=K5X1S3_AGABU|nr:uncharacterized protein AGABI1DRAFT_115534 [Agaricus bisporus var. burnettii JB137-S8]EKM76867.1 hypothetical protein AGABI1DRAFT_115534 [Agaricus bisporus var. burnettii JB137-S8]